MSHPNRKICIFTSTRAEYGLLYWLLRKVDAHPLLTLQILASGSHLSEKFGNTQQQIERDGFQISAAVPLISPSDSAKDTVIGLSVAMQGFADALTRLQPDVLVVLGDRFETLTVVQCAHLMKVPVLHIHGGEITEGAVDDAMRHAITKLSHFHCAATEVYRQRIIQMGELPETVINTGTPGLEFAKNCEYLNRDELAQSLDRRLDKPFFVLTYHPVTLAEESPGDVMTNILSAIDAFPDHQVIITYPNIDAGHEAIIEQIEAYGTMHSDRVILCKSLGSRRFMSAMKYATMVIGNSSSGIIEAPFFSIPTINIGNRQKGRLSATSVIHCATDKDAIEKAIAKGIELKNTTEKWPVENPYGSGDSCGQILDVLVNQQFEIVKRFYDLPKDCDLPKD